MYTIFKQKGKGGVMSEKAEVTFKSWIAQNLFQIARFIFAIVIMVAVTTTFLDIGKIFLTKEINSIIITPVSITSTETKPFVDAVPVVTDSNEKTDLDKNEKQIKTIKSEEGTATQQVLAYALQLVAWFGLMGISLWAIVALTRDE